MLTTFNKLHTTTTLVGLALGKIFISRLAHYNTTRQMQGIVGRAFVRIVNVKLLANEAISCSRLVTCPRYPYCS